MLDLIALVGEFQLLLISIFIYFKRWILCLSIGFGRLIYAFIQLLYTFTGILILY